VIIVRFVIIVNDDGVMIGVSFVFVISGVGVDVNSGSSRGEGVRCV
jgi:hypothetical protein